MNIRRILFVSLLLATLAACQTIAPQPVAATSAAPDLHAEYHALAANNSVVYTIDPAASRVRIYVFRGGKAAKLGHNHVLDAPRFTGYVDLPSDDPTQARFDLQVPLADLTVDDPAQRAETGGNFSGERAPSDIAGTQANMLGTRGLDASQYPLIQFHSAAIAGDWPVLVADIDVTLHGVTRRQSVMLRVQHSASDLQVQGTLVLRQSDFGVTPFSVFGGLLSVQDAVAVEFSLIGRPAPF